MIALSISQISAKVTYFIDKNNSWSPTSLQ